MNHRIKLKRSRAPLLAAITLAGALSSALAAFMLPPADTVAPAQAVPPALDPGEGATLAMTVAARGVQIYQCRPQPAPASGHAWSFVAPEADLVDRLGRIVGHHGAGPYWQARDGSRVVGTPKARADAPDAGAIPWLLLSATASGPDGLFSRVTSIQRINTIGGNAPASACTAELAGQSARIAYRADYRLFVGGGGSNANASARP